VTRQWITLRALEQWIDDEHLIRLAQGNSLRRRTEFPTKAIGRRKPNVAGGDQRLRERAKRARLDEIRGPGLQIRLAGKPAVKDSVGVGGWRRETPKSKHQTQNSQTWLMRGNAFGV